MLTQLQRHRCLQWRERHECSCDAFLLQAEHHVAGSQEVKEMHAHAGAAAGVKDLRRGVQGLTRRYTKTQGGWKVYHKHLQAPADVKARNVCKLIQELRMNISCFQSASIPPTPSDAPQSWLRAA